MKRGLIVLLFAGVSQVFQSCSLFQQTKSSTWSAAMKTKEKSSKVEQLNTLDKSLGWSFATSDDSLNMASRVVIWPRGEFHFSPQDGFYGMAEKVVISGTLKSGSKVLEEKIQQEEQYQSASLKAEQVKSMQQEQKDRIKESVPMWSWWWFLLLLPLLLGLRWIRHAYKSW